MKYRLLTGSHGRWEDGKSVRYVAGDEIDLSPEEVESFGKRVEPVGGVAKAPPKPTPEPTQPLGLADLNWSDAAEAVSKLDAEALDAAEAEERAGKDRKRVHEAIEARRAELAE